MNQLDIVALAALIVLCGPGLWVVFHRSNK